MSKTQKKAPKEASKRYQFYKEKETKYKKLLETDIKIFLKKKKEEKNVSFMKNVIIIFLKKKKEKQLNMKSFYLAHNK